MPPVILEPGSFRDKSNRVFYKDGHVYRALSRLALDHWTLLETKTFFQCFSQEGKIVSTRLAHEDLLRELEGHSWAAMLEHESIPFISYPYEWSFGMLQDAALLQLELLSAALREDMTLKDASPYNIQWKGSQPVFIDIPSFIPWTPGSPWIGYRQFCELFLFPLLLQAYRDIPFQPWLRGSLEGISIEAGSRLLARDFYRPGVLTDVLLHSYFQKSYAETTKHVKNDLHQVGFRKELIQSNVSRLTKIVSKLSWNTAPSHWSDYRDTKNYSVADNEAKRNFVDSVLEEKRRRLIWDLGCNSGEFTLLASDHADYVVAVDSDPKVIETLYQSFKPLKSHNILPMVMNLANFSSGLGWLGQERKAFVERGKPDLILCLALVHHVAISSNIPMAEWIHWLASLGADLVIEFVMPEDPMVQKLLRNKDDNHADYTQECFEAALHKEFVVRNRQMMGSGQRILYACHVK